MARIVLQESPKPLSLQRVPPNLLVGDGATDFAHEFGLPIVPNELLVSPGAKDRWQRWRKDLDAARAREEDNIMSPAGPSSRVETADTGVNTQKKPLSPPKSPDVLGDAAPPAQLPTTARPLVASTSDVPALSMPRKQTPFGSFCSPSSGSNPATFDNHYNGDSDSATDPNIDWLTSPPKRPKIKSSYDGSDVQSEVSAMHKLGVSDSNMDDRQDHITDTVGAIAIDGWGKIAAGSSSGGIGMKHKGRCGPAALVGIGTAVIPADPTDPAQTTVATVTSGTGEHMATTAAAHTAAERILNCLRKENNKMKPCTEDQALESMIKNDFMRHPGVKDSPCAGAIGILAVKKQRDGIFFYFGHNTDSFALASMHSEERKPVCAMSRSKGNSSIAQGGRLSRSRQARS